MQMELLTVRFTKINRLIFVQLQRGRNIPAANSHSRISHDDDGDLTSHLTP
jgi:hypothetical protein